MPDAKRCIIVQPACGRAWCTSRLRRNTLSKISQLSPMPREDKDLDFHTSIFAFIPQGYFFLILIIYHWIDLYFWNTIPSQIIAYAQIRFLMIDCGINIQLFKVPFGKQHVNMQYYINCPPWHYIHFCEIFVLWLANIHIWSCNCIKTEFEKLANNFISIFTAISIPFPISSPEMHPICCY